MLRPRLPRTRCCRVAVAVRDRCVCLSWACCACPFRSVDAAFVSLPSFLIRLLLSVDAFGVVAGVLMGLFYSYAVFLPLARVYEDYTRPLCLSYVGVLAWSSGHVFFALAASMGLVASVYVYEEQRKAKARWVPMMPTSDGAYFGLLVGLVFAFPVMTTEKVDHAGGDNQDVRWCQAGQNWHILFVYLPVFLFALLDAKMGPRKQTGQQEDDENDVDEDTDDLYDATVGSDGARFRAEMEELDLDKLLAAPVDQDRI